MANTLLTSDVILRRQLMVLENNLVAAKFVNREYNSEFAQGGAKIGASLRIRKPPRTVVTKAVTFVAQDQVDEYTVLTVDKQHHVGMSFTQQELTLSVEEFSYRYIEPAMASLANDIDQTILAEYWNIYNAVGVPGTIPGSTGPTTPATGPAALFLYGSAMAKMDYEAVPRDDRRSMIVDPMASVMLVSALSGLFHSSVEVREQYKTGTMGLAIGAKFSMDQNIAVHTVGPLGGTPLMDGVGVAGATTALTKGWTNGNASRLKHGDIFTIANVYAVNPQSRTSTGQLRQFVVTADFSDTAGGGTISFLPALIASGAQQTINALPADNAALTILGAASTVSPQHLLLHQDAITLACVDLENPMGYGAWGGRISDKTLGISMTMARQYSIDSSAFKTRIDVLFGVKTVRPELAVRVVG